MHIDLYSARSFAAGHPVDQYAYLRENAPCHWQETPNGSGYWALTRYEDVNRVGRDTGTFSSEPTVMIDDSGPDGLDLPTEHRMMLMMDPPDHTAYRKLVSREFLPKRSQAMAVRMSNLARQIVDEVIERGECDFVTDIAGEMPSYVIAEMLGLPLDDGRKLYELTEVIHTAREALPEGAQSRAIADMFAYAQNLISERRGKPGEDLASILLNAEVDGKRLEDMEFCLFFMLLIDAGGDTTRNLVAGGMLELLGRPAVLADLRGDLDGLLPTARDELLRWISPVVHFRRRAKRDTVVAGQEVQAGERVVVYYGAANRDPRVFDDPERLDITRSPNPHLAFGSGAHICLGQHLAKVEIDTLLREVLTRMQDLELAGEPTRLASNFICGPTSMPVTFRQAARSDGPGH